MSSEKDEFEQSEGGSTIYRHQKESEWQPAGGEGSISEISDHIEMHLGKVAFVFHEIMSDTVHIDVHFVRPTSTCPYNVIVTSGMSDLPMHTPDRDDLPKYAELMMVLPADWRLDEESFKNEIWYWPVRCIKYLARLPHKHQTWLGWGHTIPNGNPARSFAENTDLNGVILLSPISAPESFEILKIGSEKTISFFSVVPLYEEEMQLKLRAGTKELLRKFEKANLSDIVDLRRTNVATRKKWFGFI